MSQEGSLEEESRLENERLSSLSVSQQLEWTGLSGNASNDPASLFASETPVLWNMLGFALNDTDYQNLCLVSQSWNSMVRVLEPPVMISIRRCLNKKPINGNARWMKPQDVELLTTSMQMLVQSNSTLYRKHDPSSSTPWPAIQPHFNVLLMRLVYELCTHRPENFSRNVYESTVSFLDSFAHQVVDNIWTHLHTNQETIKTLASCVHEWQKWQGVLMTTCDIVEYINRYYTKHHSLPSSKDKAETTMGHVLGESLRSPEFWIVSKLMDHVLTETSQCKAQPYLMFQVSQMCEKMGRLVMGTSFRQGDMLIPKYQNTCQVYQQDLERGKNHHDSIKSAELQASSEGPPVSITVRGGACFEFPCTSDFIQSSGFLRRLRLQPGDKIGLSVSQAVMAKAVEFYAMAQVAPLPVLATPLRSSNLRGNMDDVYATFIESASRVELCDMILFSNMMGQKELQDSCCFQMSLMIRGRSAAELRELFHLP